MKETSRSTGIKRNYLAETWKEYGGDFQSEDDFRKTLALWPVCPECGRRRTVRCPVCGHEGNLFPPGDVDFWDGVNEVPGKLTGPIASEFAPGGCHCGSCCGGHHQKAPPHEGQGASETAATGGTKISGAQGATGGATKPPRPARSLLNSDSELYPGVRDWRKPLWNFSDGDGVHGDGSEENADGNNEDRLADGDTSSADSPKENGTWEAPAPEESRFPGMDEKSFSVSNPNYFRRPMATIDLVPGESELVETSEKSDSDSKPTMEAQSDRGSEKWPPAVCRGAALVVCPVCDEPFVPKYRPRCEGCGHLFDEGAEPDESVSPSITDNESDPLTAVSRTRMIVVLAALTALAAAAVLYFGRLCQ